MAWNQFGDFIILDPDSHSSFFFWIRIRMQSIRIHFTGFMKYYRDSYLGLKGEQRLEAAGFVIGGGIVPKTYIIYIYINIFLFGHNPGLHINT